MDYKDIERSIIVRFRKEIWRLFTKAVDDYKLINENDVIAVCISGGKDSFLMAKCIEELQKHGKVKFDVKYIVMDPGYTKEVRKKISKNAAKLNIPIDMFESDIFKVSEKLSKEHPCYMCARMRRGALYAYAKKLGCNKIALGHHFDDVIETTMLSMLYAGEIKTMMPKVKSDNFKGMELIRPLYYVHEDDIKAWARYNHLEFINCACKFTLENDTYGQTSKRKEIKTLIKSLKENNKVVDKNIFKSVQNVNLNTVLEYKKDGIRYNFMDFYEDENENNKN